MANSRKYYLDWLRVIVVLLIIPHHVAVTYSHIGKGYIYTEKVVNSVYYFIQSDFLNLWFMILLFFISGISAYYSIIKRDNRGFIVERVKKLLVPVIFYLVILGPLSAYVVQYKVFNFTGSLFSFYTIYLSNIQTFIGWAQMWYCVYLFTFSIITLPILKFLIQRKDIINRFNEFLINGNNLFLPLIFFIVVEVLLRPLYPGYQNLISDWANFVVYLSFFILGFFIGQSINLLNKISFLYKKFLILSLLSSGLYIVIHYFNLTLLGLNIYVLALLKGVAEYSWVIVFISLSKKYLNVKNKWLVGLSKSSFGLYIFHYFILTVLNIYILPLNINHYIKFIITIILTYVIYYIFYKLVILRIKPLRSLCGI